MTTSPGFISRSGSLFSGEKWQTQLLTDMHVGKAMPANFNITFLINAAQNATMVPVQLTQSNTTNKDAEWLLVNPVADTAHGVHKSSLTNFQEIS